MPRLWKYALASLVATFAVLAAFAGPAAAARSVTGWCGYTPKSDASGSARCGHAYFESEVGDGTERLYLYDTNADGWGVVVWNYRYDLDDVGPYKGTLTSGSGSNKYWELHIPEGTYILFRVCPYTSASGTIDYYCGDWVEGIA